MMRKVVNHSLDWTLCLNTMHPKTLRKHFLCGLPSACNADLFREDVPALAFKKSGQHCRVHCEKEERYV